MVQFPLIPQRESATEMRMVAHSLILFLTTLTVWKKRIMR